MGFFASILFVGKALVRVVLPIVVAVVLQVLADLFADVILGQSREMG